MVRKTNRTSGKELIGKVSLYLGRMFIISQSVNVKAAHARQARGSYALNDLTYYKVQSDTESIQMLYVKQLCIFKFFNFFLSVNF